MRNRLVNEDSRLSIQPPKNPAMAPMMVPMIVVSSATVIAMVIEIWPPVNTRTMRSRPIWSVPNGWVSDGPWFGRPASTWS